MNDTFNIQSPSLINCSEFCYSNRFLTTRSVSVYSHDLHQANISFVNFHVAESVNMYPIVVKPKALIGVVLN